MFITPQPDRKFPGKFLAFYRTETKNFGERNFRCFFDASQDPLVLAEGKEIEVMICGVMLPKNQEDGIIDWDGLPRVLFIREPVKTDKRIIYGGFSVSGSMCQNIATGFFTDEDDTRSYEEVHAAEFLGPVGKGRKASRHIGLLTPGRIEQHLNVVQHNSNDFYNKPREPEIPGRGWAEYEGGRYRMTGVASMHELRY